jgi:hypothetical protein
MLKKLFFCFLVLSFSGSFAQEIDAAFQLKKTIASRDTISIEKGAINSSFFKIYDSKNQEIDTTFYKINFQKGNLIFNDKYQNNDSISIKYLKFPEFLTKEYTVYDKEKIVGNDSDFQKLYKVSNDSKPKFVPFDGLNTSGSISRGVSVGNNQNAAVNSNLDLQITGKLSNKVSLRASIQDSNIPLQNGGYSQKLDEFDQIFMELFSEKWNIRAGDLFLENRKSQFLNFNKKVQGISTTINFGTTDNNTQVTTTAALVRGQYTKSNFVGQEGNQGPYKLRGPNGELYILVISGSERVFVNGILLKRGENLDYVIDYNAGELIFTSLFPITSEMRIAVEYQYTDRSYTRFVTYAGVNHEQQKWSLAGYVFSESDLKNQPLQQNLSLDQVQILAAAGDNIGAMNAQSAVLESYSDNKILYKKITLAGVSVFEYSNNPTDVLYAVKFSYKGNNNGNYLVSNTNANGKIFQYSAPISGILQGSYDATIVLIAPKKLQLATVLGKFKPNEKTNFDFEFGLSNNDKNLFSDLEDNDNQGFSGKINAKQRILSKKWKIDAFGNFQLLQKNFTTVERLFGIEFNRDWNLTNPIGNQQFFTTGFDFLLPNKSSWHYQFENLSFSENFSGNKHSISGFFKTKNWQFQNMGSLLISRSNIAKSDFFRNSLRAKYNFNKNWIGTTLNHENNQEKNLTTNLFTNRSQKFTEFSTFVGRGDSTKVFVELGYINRVNDSVQSGILKKVNASQSFYIKSKLIQNEHNDLAVYINYRNFKFTENKPNEPSLNSRIVYNGKFLNQLIQTSTGYENSSGTIAQQEYSFLQVETGRGTYAWNDYNGNGIQELQEFEIAAFPDQAKYVKLFLPNQFFLKTHQNKFSQSLTINPSQWQNELGFKKLASHFYNQTSYLSERKIKRDQDNFDLNPFQNSDDQLLGLNTNLRNSLFFNRAKQKHSLTYTYIYGKNKNLQSSGTQESNSISHQLQYDYLFKKYWLFTFSGKKTTSVINSENYISRNFNIKGVQLEPKISYLFNKNASLDFFYDYQNKKNQLGANETLMQNKLGTSFTISSNQKFSVNGEFSWLNNEFVGSQSTPVAFQMLEGLQPGKNTTWRLLLQRNLTQFLDLNLSYQGRNSETSATIHTGTIQLRAFF